MKHLIKTSIRKVGKVGLALGTMLGSFYWTVALATTTPAKGGTGATFSQLDTSLQNTAGNILKVVMIVITIAGILLILKGLLHLKQHHTGSPQEKHMSKGLASMFFGAALFLAIPITHILVASLGSGFKDAPAYQSWTVSSSIATPSDIPAPPKS